MTENGQIGFELCVQGVERMYDDSLVDRDIQVVNLRGDISNFQDKFGDVFAISWMD